MKTQLVYNLSDADFGVLHLECVHTVCVFVSEKDGQPTRGLICVCLPLVVTLVRACAGVGFQGIVNCCCQTVCCVDLCERSLYLLVASSRGSEV